MSFDAGDKNSVLFTGLSGFWQRFFKDAQDIEAYYRASETYLGQVYLDLLGTILNIGAIDTPVLNKENWKLFTVSETDVHIRSDFSSLSGQYAYSFPDDIVAVDILQNSVLNPSVVLERDEAFTVNDDEGCLCFLEDPFNAYLGTDNTYMPTPGVAYRTVRREVGNAAYDLAVKLYDDSTFNTGYAYRDFGMERGWTLRILAHSGNEVTAGATGAIVNNPGQVFFDAPNVGTGNVGDVIHVFGHDGGAGAADDIWKNFYVVKEIVSDDRVELEPSAVPNTLISSTSNLYWKLTKAIYFTVNGTTPFKDYTIDYYEGVKLIGPADNPFPTDLNGPLVAALIRDEPDADVKGLELTYLTATRGVPAPAFTVGAPGTVTKVTVGTQQLVPGSVKVYAYKHWDGTTGGEQVEEGVDYEVDYYRGTIHQTSYWDETSVGRCDFTVQAMVRLYGGISTEEYTVGNVKQLAYWVPEVQVDRFNLWYNYGSLLNRFDASTETYKAFLMGIMYLYMTGPVLQRIEAALNVAAEYPVASRDGEILLSYDSGEVGRGVTASLDSTTNKVSLPTSEYVFSAVDVGGYMVLSGALNDANEGKFRILSVDTTANTATLETSFGLVTETPVSWVLTHTYRKTITTDRQTYEYPYSVPIRADIVDQVNWNTLSFAAFEPLTEAFTVTDYVEDPTWWNDSVIPPTLWEVEKTNRRRSSPRMYEHVVGAEDESCIGDPGLYVGADEQGVVRTPTDPRDLVVTAIEWKRDTTVRYTFGRYPDLGLIDVTAGVTITVANSLNVANDGTFTITDVNKNSYWVEVTNGARTDATLDEDLTTTATVSLTGAVIPLSIQRHNAAYIIFDQYLKMHMYSIEFDLGLELDNQFREDLEEIILVAKPSYLYPVVDTNALFIDNVGLTSAFIRGFGLYFGSDYDDGASSLHVADNTLKIGESAFPWQVGDFYKYSTQALTPAVTDPIPVGTTVLPTLPDECSLLIMTVGATRTADGEPALEGRDYTVNWLAEDPVGTVNPVRWQIEFLTECTAGGLTLPLSCYIAERQLGTYNTTEGWTPSFIGGLNPWYIRNGALDPSAVTYAAEFEALRTEYIDRPVQLTVVPDTETPTVSYTYP